MGGAGRHVDTTPEPGDLFRVLGSEDSQPGSHEAEVDDAEPAPRSLRLAGVTQ